MTNRWMFPALALLPLAHAQSQKHLDLTGKPQATISEPFTKVSGVRELTANLAVVTDQGEFVVMLADFARGSASPIGTKGRGPKEYQFPYAPLGTPDGGALIVDGTLRRALIVNASGTITGMHPFPESSDLSRSRGTDNAGLVYFQGGDFNPNTGGFSDSVNVVRWNPATNSVEQVARVWSGGRVILERKSGRASLAREITPFPNLDSWVVLPDGRVALIRHEPFRIDLVTRPGVIARGPAISYTPIRITAEERNLFRQKNTPGRVGAVMIGGGTGPQTQGSQWEDAHFPEAMPPYIGAAVHATPDGEIWIGRSFSGADKTRKYEIYDGTGRLIGSASFKANASVVGFGPRSVYVARVNPDDDLVYLEKYAR